MATFQVGRVPIASKSEATYVDIDAPGMKLSVAEQPIVFTVTQRGVSEKKQGLQLALTWNPASTGPVQAMTEVILTGFYKQEWGSEPPLALVPLQSNEPDLRRVLSQHVDVVSAVCLSDANMVVVLIPGERDSVHARIKTAVGSIFDEFSIDVAKELSLQQVGLSIDDCAEFRRGLRCKFWFLRADKILEHDGSQLGLPTLQQLRTTHRDWLVQEEIVFISGCFSKYSTRMLAVSHCERNADAKPTPPPPPQQPDPGMTR
jgi:hypothetical protein